MICLFVNSEKEHQGSPLDSTVRKAASIATLSERALPKSWSLVERAPDRWQIRRDTPLPSG
jgi:hypothetical protein